jgi:hypothetical protein
MVPHLQHVDLMQAHFLARIGLPNVPRTHVITHSTPNKPPFSYSLHNQILYSIANAMVNGTRSQTLPVTTNDDVEVMVSRHTVLGNQRYPSQKHLTSNLISRNNV